MFICYKHVSATGIWSEVNFVLFYNQLHPKIHDFFLHLQVSILKVAASVFVTPGNSGHWPGYSGRGVSISKFGHLDPTIFE
jgi:hypothetical protein